MIVALIGDLEGDRDWAVSRLRELGERGDVQVACQLGDLRFGMGPDHEAYLAAIEAVCAEFDLRLLCINGNHENWDRLDQLWSEPRWQCKDGSLKPIEVSAHVWLLPRGHRWEMGGRSFVALGGAPSVNRLRLTEGVTWWPSEVITEEHVAATVAGGHAEIMFTHDSPAPPYCTEPVADVMVNNPNDWPDSILAYARLPGARHPTTIWSLGANGDPANVRLLDLETLADANPEGSLGREGVGPGEVELGG